MVWDWWLWIERASLTQAKDRTATELTGSPKYSSSFLLLPEKLSVAVCIGFLAAWSPYAVVSMWAAFGPVDNIPPLAFAMPAMFAKSSTIYNPIIYLTLRPNIRRLMCRNLGALCPACVKRCRCSEGPVRVRLGTVRRHSNGLPLPPPGQPPRVVLRANASSCSKDAFEGFSHCPQICSISASSSQAQDAQRGSHKKSLLATVCAKRTSEIENLHINLEMLPGQAKVAWPWHKVTITCVSGYTFTNFWDIEMCHRCILDATEMFILAF